MARRRIAAYLALGVGMLLCSEALAGPKISNTNASARRPELAYSGGILHVVDFESQDIVYYRSVDRGRTWGGRTVLGPSAALAATSTLPGGPIGWCEASSRCISPAA
jgi:hypothetical protein